MRHRSTLRVARTQSCRLRAKHVALEYFYTREVIKCGTREHSLHTDGEAECGSGNQFSQPTMAPVPHREHRELSGVNISTTGSCHGRGGHV